MADHLQTELIADALRMAVTESFFATLKTELVHHERYATRQQAEASHL